MATKIKGGRDKELLAYKVTGDIRTEANKLARKYRKLGAKGGLVTKAYELSLTELSRLAVTNLDNSSKAHRRVQYARSGNLARVIRSKESHSVSTRGFRFMVEEKVRAQIDYAFSLEYGDRSQVGRDIYFLFLGRKKSGTPIQRQNLRADHQEQHRTSHRNNPFRSNHPHVGVQTRTGPNAHNYVTDRIIGPREFNSGGKQTSAFPFRVRQNSTLAKGGGPLRSNYIAGGKRFQVRIKNPVPEYAYGRKAGATFLKDGTFMRLLKAELARFEEETRTQLLEGKKQPGREVSKEKTKAARRLKGRGLNGDVTVTKIPVVP